MVNALQAHFAKFTGRDAAMSKSLNSDYLSQLYIRADTKSMDKELVKAEVATRGLPEEAQALVVVKRGSGFTEFCSLQSVHAVAVRGAFIIGHDLRHLGVLLASRSSQQKSLLRFWLPA